MLSPADVVERLLDAGDPAEATLELLAPDAEVKPFESDQVLRGLPEIKRYAAGQKLLGRPSVESAMLYELGENALVLTLLGVTRERGESSFTEMVAVGWVVTVREGKIARIYSYPSWEAAREAAGVTQEHQGRSKHRRRAQGFMMRARAAWPRAAY
jgi:ketosteroid isomerase-like protein